MLKDAFHRFWAIKSTSDMMILAICGDTRLTLSFLVFFLRLLILLYLFGSFWSISTG